MGNKSDIMREYEIKHQLYQEFAQEVQHQLEQILQTERIVYNAITSRLKNRESLINKIDQKEDKYTCLNDLTDIAGVRVITYYIEDVDKIAEIVEQEFLVDSQNSIDKREALEPDRFGYCSVHYIVEMSSSRLKLREYQKFVGLKCEIQIRSVLQHAWAEIEHDLGYKSEVAIPKSIRRNFSRLAGLLEIADKEFQEIRSFLLSYQHEAEEKIRSNELQDTEIDAVLLTAMAKTDPDIKELNETLSNILGKDFDEGIPAQDIEHLVRRLHWLGIYTFDQLQNFITKNKEKAVAIAKIIYSDGHSGRESISKLIAFLYLCYAELLRNNPSYDQIMQYVKVSYYGRMNEHMVEESAKYLLRLKDNLKVST